MITITESAKAKIKDLLLEENNPKLALRTFVQGGGCSGFAGSRLFGGSGGFLGRGALGRRGVSRRGGAHRGGGGRSHLAELLLQQVPPGLGGLGHWRRRGGTRLGLGGAGASGRRIRCRVGFGRRRHSRSRKTPPVPAFCQTRSTGSDTRPR